MAAPIHVHTCANTTMSCIIRSQQHKTHTTILYKHIIMHTLNKSITVLLKISHVHGNCNYCDL